MPAGRAVAAVGRGGAGCQGRQGHDPTVASPKHQVQRKLMLATIAIGDTWGVELRQLEYFVAVAEEQNFTRAAARLHVVQSAVSAAVKTLERELGASLLDRNSKRVRLTDAGAALLPRARIALDAARDARDAVAEVHGGLRGTLRIGTMTSIRLAAPASPARRVPPPAPRSAAAHQRRPARLPGAHRRSRGTPARPRVRLAARQAPGGDPPHRAGQLGPRPRRPGRPPAGRPARRSPSPTSPGWTSSTPRSATATGP